MNMNKLRIAILMYYHLKSGPDFKWFNHLKTGHWKVRYSDESGIQVLGIQMVTVLLNQASELINEPHRFYSVIFFYESLIPMVLQVEKWIIRWHYITRLAKGYHLINRSFCYQTTFQHFWMVRTLAMVVAMVPIILITNHPKSKHQNIPILNGFWIWMFGIRAPTVPD